MELDTDPLDISSLGRASSLSLLSASRRSLVAGGALFALGNLFHPLTHSANAYDYPTWELAHLVMVGSAPLLMLGLPFLYNSLQGLGRVSAAKAAVVLLLLGWTGIAPSSVIEAFVAPEVGHDTMERLGSGGLGMIVGLFGTTFLAGTIVLGWHLHRARLGPRGVGLSLIASGAALVVPVVLGLTDHPAAGAIIIASAMTHGIGIASLGLVRSPSSPTS